MQPSGGKGRAEPKPVCYSGKTVCRAPADFTGVWWSILKGYPENKWAYKFREKEGMFLFEYEMGWNFQSEGAILGIPITVVWQSRCSSSAWVLNLAGQRAFFSWALFHIERMSRLF